MTVDRVVGLVAARVIGEEDDNFFPKGLSEVDLAAGDFNADAEFLRADCLDERGEGSYANEFDGYGEGASDEKLGIEFLDVEVINQWAGGMGFLIRKGEECAIELTGVGFAFLR